MKEFKGTRARVRALALGGATTMLLAVPLGSAALADLLPTGATVAPDGSVVSDGVVIGSVDATGSFVPLPPPVDQAVEAVESTVEAGVTAAEAAPGTVVEAVGQTPVVQPAPAPQPPPVPAPAPAAPPAVAAAAAAPAPVAVAGGGAAINPVPANRSAPQPAQAAAPPEAAPSVGGKVAPALRNTGGPKLQSIASLSTPFDFLSPLAAAREEAAIAAPSGSAAGGVPSIAFGVMELGSTPNVLLTLAGGLIGLLLAAHIVRLRRGSWS